MEALPLTIKETIPFEVVDETCRLASGIVPGWVEFVSVALKEIVTAPSGYTVS
jgi:hypothetical protein